VEKLLTIKQLGEVLQVKPKTIYQWTHVGFIPHIKFPKGVRFSEAEVNEWLKKRQRKGRASFKMPV